MTKVGEHNVSPYLTQRLRSLEEVQAERERRQRELGQQAQTSAENQPQPEPAKPNAAQAVTPADETVNRPGRIFDESV